MAALPGSVFNINGHYWQDVTNVTATGPTYKLRDVLACGGRRPWIVSVHAEDDPNYRPPEPKPNNIKQARKILTKPKERVWMKNPNDRNKSWKL